MSSMAAPYSRRNASGDRRSSQRYIRMSRLAADTACAAVPLARALPGARLPAPRLVVPPCQREVLAPRIHVAGSVNRDNESFVRETAQYLVQGTGRGVEASARLLLDVLSDRVSVRRPLAEREEDVEHQVGQGRSRVDFLHGSIGRCSPSEGWLTSNYSSATIVAV